MKIIDMGDTIVVTCDCGEVFVATAATEEKTRKIKGVNYPCCPRCGRTTHCLSCILWERQCTKPEDMSCTDAIDAEILRRSL